MRFEEIAERENVILCVGCELGNHQRGLANPSRGTVHWTPRRVTRSGLRRFLMLVAAIKKSHNRGQPTWVKVYEQNAYAYRRALSEYHVRLSRKLSLNDRANVRFRMGKAGVLGEPQYTHIARWAMERSNP